MLQFNASPAFTPSFTISSFSTGSEPCAGGEDRQAGVSLCAAAPGALRGKAAAA